MRDAAEDIGDYNSEIDAYYEAGVTLQKMQEYDQALKSFKRMLQVSWSFNKGSSEIKAYDMVAKMYFYLGNVPKAAYYH